MKKTIVLFLLILSFKTIYAKCKEKGIEFYPLEKEISLSPMFIIKGYGLSQKTIKSFAERIIYLESENGDVIELQLQEILKGKVNITQAIFKPLKTLNSFTTYFLKYTNQTKNEGKEMTRYNKETEEVEKIHWKTTNKKTQQKLNKNLSISFDKVEVEEDGCGPFVNVIFNVKNNLASEIWYKTEVMEIDTKHTDVFYLKEHRGKLYVGHGMCAGAFTFYPKLDYKARFTPMNTDGKALKPTNWTTFNIPYKN